MVLKERCNLVQLEHYSLVLKERYSLVRLGHCSLALRERYMRAFVQQLGRSVWEQHRQELGQCMQVL